jgi:very-short-patch-repair endonuclease
MPEERAKQRKDAAIASVAARQHGVVSAQQLYFLEVTSSAIGDRVEAGRLHRIHRGVYAVGHPRVSHEGRWMAAVLACGQGAVLSHRSAAELWRMLSPQSPGHDGDEVPTHVTVMGGGRSRRGVRVHRSSTLSPDDCTRRAGIPVTSPPRTLADLRRTVASGLFATAIRQAEFLHLPIGERLRSDHTRSELEMKFLTLVRRHHLPQPEVNARLHGFVVDFLWRSDQLVAELDGWRTHGTRSAFEADRTRDNRLRVLGFQVVRFTWRHVVDESEGVARTIRSLLVTSSGHSGSSDQKRQSSAGSV